MISRPKFAVVAAAMVAASLFGIMPAAAEGNGEDASRPPIFTPTLYADGEVWGTNLNGTLPAPKGNNRHSFDDLYVATNGVDGQMPVAEAAPGPGYNGGRWAVVEVTWADPSAAVLLTSSDQVQSYADAGMLTTHEVGVYFSCPLLPVK